MIEVKDGKIQMSTGVIFRVVDVPVMAFEAVKKKLTKNRPEVPVVYLEAKSRDEPNPNDPSYLDAMDDYESELYEKLLDMAVMMGVEADSLPDDFPKAEDEKWTVKLKKLGVDIPETDQIDERFLSWVKLCAAPTVEDMASLIVACSRNAGVTEEDVTDVSQTFLNRAQRRANSKTPR